jgi:hypothetical protein
MKSPLPLRALAGLVTLSAALAVPSCGGSGGDVPIGPLPGPPAPTPVPVTVSGIWTTPRAWRCGLKGSDTLPGTPTNWD